MMGTVSNWIAYQRTFTLSERWERAKEKVAQFVAWHLLPRRVCLWVVVRRHADVTKGNTHPGSVSAFDLYKDN